jgi:DNA repair exonuclease SbcCD ATPase subunit
MTIEIEMLNGRLAEAEVKLKTEVQRIKKKMQMQITELEMSLDVANKNNIELQKTVKKQSLQLTVSNPNVSEVFHRYEAYSSSVKQHRAEAANRYLFNRGLQ